LTITIIATISTSPFYYADPIEQFFVQIESSKSHSTWNTSVLDGAGTSPLSFLFVFSATIIPTVDTYYYLLDSENIPTAAEYGHTFTTIPLTIFSLIGFCYILQKLRNRKLNFSEFFLLAWYFPIFIFSGLITDSYNVTRYFLPLMFPMILMMSYGLSKFIENISSNKLKVFFVSLFILSHGITYLIFWKRIYFDPTIIWVLPVDINLRHSLSEPIVYITSIIFIITFLILFFKNRLNKYYQSRNGTKVID